MKERRRRKEGRGIRKETQEVWRMKKGENGKGKE